MNAQARYYSSLYLAHHGVKGQKWGVKNGPPYPLDAEGKKALRAQKKAMKKEAIKDFYNRHDKLDKVMMARKAALIAGGIVMAVGMGAAMAVSILEGPVGIMIAAEVTMILGSAGMEVGRVMTMVDAIIKKSDQKLQDENLRIKDLKVPDEYSRK